MAKITYTKFLIGTEEDRVQESKFVCSECYAQPSSRSLVMHALLFHKTHEFEVILKGS